MFKINLSDINNANVLEKEHLHVNKLLEDINANLSKAFQWFYGSLILAIGIVFSIAVDYSIQFSDKKVGLPLLEFCDIIPFLFKIMIFTVIAIIMLFVSHLVKLLADKRKVLIRKEKIFELIIKYKDY